MSSNPATVAAPISIGSETNTTPIILVSFSYPFWMSSTQNAVSGIPCSKSARWYVSAAGSLLVVLLNESQNLGVELQGLVLIVDHDTAQLDLHSGTVALAMGAARPRISE